MLYTVNRFWHCFSQRPNIFPRRFAKERPRQLCRAHREHSRRITSVSGPSNRLHPPFGTIRGDRNGKHRPWLLVSFRELRGHRGTGNIHKSRFIKERGSCARERSVRRRSGEERREERTRRLGSASAFKVLPWKKGAALRERRGTKTAPREEDVALIFIREKREAAAEARTGRGEPGRDEMKCKCLNEPLRDCWSTY